MNTRVATIMAATDLGASGTKIIDINIKDVISRITINFRAVNADAAIVAHPAANVEKIELVDGSDVLFSLSGFQAQALNFYDRAGKIPNTSLRTYASTQRALFGMDFGRFLFDPALAFDPTKFTNPQLKITFDRTKANAACVTSDCEVLAHIFDELAPTPAGFLMAKEIYSYTVGTTGYEYIDMPTDYITQQIYAKAFLAPYGMTSIFDAFKLSEDNDKKIPLDLSADEMERIAFEAFGYVKEHAKLNGAAGVANFFGMPTDSGFANGSTEGGDDDFSVFSQGGGQFACIMTAGTYRGRATLIGNCPHGTVPLLPKPGPEIADWYDVTKLGSLKLRIDDSAPAADTYTGEIIIKQYRPFA